MLRSPVAGERDAAVVKINRIMANHDWEDVLGAPAGVIWVPLSRRPAPVYRPMTPEESVLVGEMLALGEKQGLSGSDRKRLSVWKRRGSITETQARELRGDLKRKFEHAKRWKVR